MRLKQCRCGGWTVRLRLGLCTVCLYAAAMNATGDQDAAICAAIANALTNAPERAPTP